MSQIGRNLTDAVDGILNGKRCLIHDRDPLFTTEFLDMLADVSVKSVKLPPRSPNLNAHAERFVRTIKESCLEPMILFGEESLRTTSLLGPLLPVLPEPGPGDDVLALRGTPKTGRPLPRYLQRDLRVHRGQPRRLRYRRRLPIQSQLASTSRILSKPERADGCIWLHLEPVFARQKQT